MKPTQVNFAELAQQLANADKSNDRQQLTRLVQTLADVVAQTAVANVYYLRDGELVVYRRERSRVWQCKFKLYTNAWRACQRLILQLPLDHFPQEKV